MDEVAEAAADAALATVKAAAGLAEVGDGAELAVDGAGGVPARVEVVAGALGRLLVLEAGVDVADEVVVVVVADDELLDLAVLAHLAPDVLVEGVEVVLQLRRVHAVLGVEGRVLVQVRHEDRLAVRGLDVLARAPVAVAAGADLVVEGAVDLFCSVPGVSGAFSLLREVLWGGGSARKLGREGDVTYLVLLRSEDASQIGSHVDGF